MQAALFKADLLTVHEQTLEQRKRCAVIDSSSVCSLCNLHIGAATFVIYPTGRIAHFSCHRKQGSKSLARERREEKL